MKAFINNNVQLWFQKDEGSNPLFVCEDVTDVDAVANYLVTLRMVREGAFRMQMQRFESVMRSQKLSIA